MIFRHMGPPILPTPMNPTFMAAFSSCAAGLSGAMQGNMPHMGCVVRPSGGGCPQLDPVHQSCYAAAMSDAESRRTIRVANPARIDVHACANFAEGFVRLTIDLCPGPRPTR